MRFEPTSIGGPEEGSGGFDEAVVTLGTVTVTVPWGGTVGVVCDPGSAVPWDNTELPKSISPWPDSRCCSSSLASLS